MLKPTVVLKLFAGQGTEQTDRRADRRTKRQLYAPKREKKQKGKKEKQAGSILQPRKLIQPNPAFLR